MSKLRSLGRVSVMCTAPGIGWLTALMLDQPVRIRQILLSVFVTLIAVSHVAAQGGPAASPAVCDSLMRLQMPGVALIVTKTQQFPAGTTPSGSDSARSTVKLPAYCRVDGMIDRRTGGRWSHLRHWVRAGAA